MSKGKKILSAAALLVVVGIGGAGAYLWSQQATGEEYIHAEPAASTKPVGHLLFSDEWARAYGEKINESKAYHDAAQGWRWPVALCTTADPKVNIKEGGIVLDLYDGVCRKAHLGTKEEIDKCAFILVASPQQWKKILQKEEAVLPSILAKKVTLKKGSYFTLTKYMKAANEMTLQGSRVDTIYQEGL